MYSFDSRVRYSEVSMRGELSTPGIVNYFQDCSTFQSEELGRGDFWLKEQNRFWVINSWQVKILRRPKLAENIQICTWPHSLKGMFGERNFCIRDEEGRDLIQAETLWTYMDVEKMRPTKIDEDVMATYKLEPAIATKWKGRKISVPKEGEAKPPVVVGTGLLDTNGHVNNGKYVLLAMEYVPADFEIGAFRVEYRKAAWPGDVMIPVVSETPEGMVIVFKSRQEEIFAVIELERG